MHTEKSEYAGKTAKIKEGTIHPQFEKFGGQEIQIEDWWDRGTGGSWMDARGNPSCMIYAMRIGFSKIPVPADDEVLYGHVGSFGHLVHISEIEPNK